MIVLDTDAVSVVASGRAPFELANLLEKTPVSEQATTAITMGELVFGSQRVGRPQLYMRAVAMLGGAAVLPFDDYAAEQYGVLRAGLEARGTPLADADLRIAATVLLHDATLVTGNARHFGRVPDLKLLDWRRLP